MTADAQTLREIADRIGDWMETASGRKVWPLDIRPGDVTPEDVAHALSMTCRYGGHTRRFYSVAEHCCHLSDYAVDRGQMGLAFDLLIHDAAEAYLGDIPRPLKSCLGAGWKAVEKAADEACTFALGGTWPWSADVKKLDLAILLDERSALMSENDNRWRSLDGLLPLGVRIMCWQPEEAKAAWLSRFAALRALAASQEPRHG